MKSLIKRKLISLFISLFLISSLFIPPDAFAKAYVFKWTNIKEIEVTAVNLNIRTGPSTAYPVIGYLRQGKVVTVLGSLGSWYVIQTDNDMVGAISSTYTRVKSYHNNPSTPAPTPTPPKETTPSENLSQDEQSMLDLINAERTKNGLSPLKANMEVMKVARVKAEDLSKNKYFSHQSPTYGSPFDMLKSFGVSYKSAGENIAGNSSVSAAHTSLMNSPGHRANILNSKYNYVGIGVYSDSRYGKVFVQMFIQK